MVAPVNANINVLVNTQQAMAQLRALQGQITTLNNSVSATSGAAAAQQAALAKAFQDSANASRMWNARIVPINTAVDQFSTALDKGRMSLGQYTRYAASQLPGMSRVFRREFDMMSRVAEQNVRQMQTQFVQLGNSATGAAQAMALTPVALDRQAASTAIATQRQMMMNRMIDLGTTKLLNWGKNTQWAGRQLMVGFTIPLGLMGAAAAKAFKEIDQGTISFKRVYGDLQTTTAEMERNLDAVKELGKEYTRYGNSLATTIELAASVAATGARNNDLTAATEQTLRLATLGLMENAEAMDAVISLQTAFQISSEDLAESIDFLNVVENETILTMQDMAVAIPRVAPVIKGLGGDVKDLAVFMTALREGGVSAEQGANALKSGLGRLINPTKAAREETEKYGISIDAIVQRNRGDLMGIVTEFGNALASLGQLEQQQVLQKVFGTYQYARLGALFKNIANDAGQAQRTMDLTAMSVEDLAKISERELSKIEEATSVKFQAAIEKLKIAIAPIGETFMKALTPIIDIASKVLDAFNNLPDGIKNAVAIAVAAIAGIGPIVLMTVGLIANGIANIGKLVQTMRKFFARLRGDTSAFNYLTKEEREAATAAQGLSGATETLTGKFVGQRRALESLVTMVGRYSQALSTAAAAAPLAFGVGAPGTASRTTPKGTVITGPRTGGTIVTGPGGIPMARGGIVPGRGNKDTVPAMLTPGESVVTKEATQKYGPIIQAMNAGTIPGFNNGVVAAQSATTVSGGRQIYYPAGAVYAPGNTPLAPYGMEKEFFRRGPGYAKELMATAVGGGIGLQKMEDPNIRVTQKLYDDYHAEVKRDVPKIIAALRLTEREMVRNGENIDNLENITAKARPQMERIFAQMEARGGMAARSATALRETFFPTTQGARTMGESRVFTAKYRGGEFESMSTGRRKVSPLQRYIKSAYGKIFGEERPSGRTFAHQSRFKVAGDIVPFAGGGMPGGRAPLPPVALREAQRLIMERSQSLEGVAQSEGRRLGTAVSRGGDEGMGNRSASIKAQKSVTQYVDGLEVGAAKNTGDAAKAGKVVGNSFADSVKQSIMSGKTSPGLIPGAAKMQYRQAQSDIRREAFNRKEMQRIGMTDAQITRQLERLKASKEKQAQAQEKQAKLAQANARLAQTNANLAQQSSKQMAVEEQARRRGLRTRVSEYFATPVGDGTQTRGQRIRGRLGGAGGGATMGLMGLSMAASMAGGSVGEMAQKIMPVTMGLMGLQMVLPMLTNPIGLAVLAITGLTAGAVYLNKQLDNTAKEAAKMGANIGGVANAMKVIEQATGFKAPQLEDRLFRFTEEDRNAMAEFGSYFESEAGSKFIQELKNATSEERYQKVATLLAQGIASGLEEEKAKAFGFAIAEATGDALLKSSLARDFANQVFGSGATTLINLEKERMRLAPSLPRTAGTAPPGFVPIGPGGVAATALGASPEVSMMATVGGSAAMGAAAGALVGLPFGGIGSAPGFVVGGLIGVLAGVGTAIFQLRGNFEALQKTTADAAQGLGFAIQSIQNLSNAEAVLEQQRISGAINYKQYTKGLENIQELEKQTSEYIGQIFSTGISSSRIMQGLESELSLVGNFTEDQIRNIGKQFSPDALAKQFFNVQTFQGLKTEEQKKYVQDVFTEVMSGLSPENIDQKLQDVRGTYTNIAEQVVDAMANGAVDIEAKFNEANIAAAIAQNMGGGINTGSRRVRQTMSPQQLASNIMSQDVALKKMGTDSLEVFTRLTEFTNQEFAKSIMASKNNILLFGEAVSKLSEYEDIKLEIIMEKGIDPDQIVYAVEAIKSIKFDTKIFGNAGVDADKLVQSMIDLGYSAMEIPGMIRAGVFEATNEIKNLEQSGIKAFNKLGNMKITPQIIASVLDLGEADNAGAIASKLSEAFPDELPTSVLPILIQLLGAEQLAALSGMPKGMLDELIKNPSAEGFTVSSPYGGVTYSPTDAQREAAATIAVVQQIGNATRPPDQKGKSGSAGGGGTESFLENLKKQIAANLQIFVRDTQGGVKAAVQKLRALNIPEQLIQAMGTGPEGLANMREFLGQSSKAMNKLLQDYFRSISGEQISELIGQRRIDKATEKSAGRLRKEGFDSERIGEILSNPEVAQTLAALKVGSPEWEKYIRQLKKAEKQSQATAKALDPVGTTLDKMSEQFDEIMAPLKETEAAFEMAFTQIEKAFEPRINASQEIIQGLEEQIALINEEIAALEKLNSADQNRIRDLERQKEMIGRQIEALERQNELDQRRIDQYRREDELRNRVAEGIERELSVMGELEEKIRETYNKKLETLDKIAETNDYIINQQKQQLGLSQALSEGDIYAATAAAQDMRATSAQFAVQQTRAGIEQGMESQIAGLRTSGGLTREQAEEQIRLIREQSYQTSLLIRDIEDQIYNRNLQIIPLKDQQRSLDDQIRAIQDQIYARETEIIGIQSTRLAPLQLALDTENKKLTSLENQMQAAKDTLIIDGLTHKQLTDQIQTQEDLYNYDLARIKANKKNNDIVIAIGKNWASVAKQINEVNKAARSAAATANDVFEATKQDINFEEQQGLISGEAAAQRRQAAQEARDAELAQIEANRVSEAESLRQGGVNFQMGSFNRGGKVMKYGMGGKVLRFPMGGLIPYSDGGKVLGEGSRDSVSAMLTPGEFVIRKTMVEKYGTSLMKAINQGSFTMPQYKVGKIDGEVEVNKNNVSNINAPVYNTYDMKFAISGSNASAEDIANRVMFKMKQVQDQGIRGNRGY